MKNNTPPRLSVILPVHNGERYLEEAIKSILEQSYSNFELLIIVDGSTDRSLPIAQGFTDSRIRILQQKKSLGLVVALNRGMNEARGELLARMDADDRALPERFAQQVQYLDAHPEVAVVGTAAYRIDESGHRLGRLFSLPGRQLKPLVWRYCPLVHPTVVLRASLLEEGYRYEAEFLHAEDYALWARLIRDGKTIAALDQPLLEYRVHAGNVSKQYRSEQFQAMYRVYTTYLGGRLSYREWAALLRLDAPLSGGKRWRLAWQQFQSGHYPFSMLLSDQLAYLFVRYFRNS